MINKKAISMYVIILVLLLSACSKTTNETNKESASQPPSASNTTATETSSDKTVELRMSWWGSDERHEKTLKAIELFEQKNPGIKITGEYSGFDGYMDKLNTQIAAGNAPDLVQMGGNIKEYVGKKAMLDLTPYVGNIINLDDFNPSLVESATFNGKLYGVTLGVSSSALLYNASMFEKASIPVPTESWTYDEMKNAAIEISQKLGKGNYGVYDLSSDAATLGAYLGSNGKELYRDGERHFEKQDMVNWFTMWEEMRAAGGLIPADVQVASPSSAVDKSLVVKGQVAIQSASASQIYGYQELTQDTLGLIMFPNGSVGSGMIPPISGQYITSYSGTEYPEEVAKFINFMVNDPEAGIILGSSRGVPPAGKIRDLLAAQSTPVDKVLYDYISLVSDTAPPVVYQQFPLDNEFTKLLLLTSEKVAFGAQKIDNAVDEFMTEFDKLLVKAKQQ